MAELVFTRCESCESEPLTEMPLALREKAAVWAFWRFHVAAHEFGREFLRTLHHLLRWDRG